MSCLYFILIQIVKKNFLNDPNEEKEGWHYLAVKKLSTLLRGPTSKNSGHFYCLNYLHSLRTDNKLKSQEKVCKKKHFCGITLTTQKIIYKNLINTWNQIKCGI